MCLKTSSSDTFWAIILKGSGINVILCSIVFNSWKEEVTLMSTHKELIILWYIYIMEYYATIKIQDIYIY